MPVLSQLSCLSKQTEKKQNDQIGGTEETTASTLIPPVPPICCTLSHTQTFVVSWLLKAFSGMLGV